ncbi:hypothetical protein [Aquimarina aggregata]|uniref:hypothetical protein n=1 Tax=Aquimarina aggregata TaxID=1642818 RepID=UPI0024912A9B|nr:hypothetical protein [Aquimarina aggregata]
MSKKHSKPIKTKWFHLEIEVNKIINIIIIIGVVAAAIAPFVHILFPKGASEKVFGFPSMRVFLFSIGLPISLFILSLFIAFLSNFIELKEFKKTMRIGSICFLFTSSYFIIWTFWYRDDFNIYFYYAAMVIVSIFASFAISKLLQSITEKLSRLKSISEKIPNLDHRIKTVNDIAKIMPDDNEDMVTYKAMVDVTGDNLKETITEIKKDLN